LADLETLRAEVKKLSSQAVQAKLNLHDLAEDLPTNWEQIPAVAEKAYTAYRELESKRALLQNTEA
jgi:hypothetical protein